MCGPETPTITLSQAELDRRLTAAREQGRDEVARDPSLELARLMTAVLNTYVNSRDVTRLICDHWSKVSVLAHRIHGGRP